MIVFRHSLCWGLAVVCWSGLWVGSGFAKDQWVKQVQPLIESSCLACHSDAEESGLNLLTLGRDLSDPAVFKKWEHVYKSQKLVARCIKKKLHLLYLE